MPSRRSATASMRSWAGSRDRAVPQAITHLALLVRDYDEAIAFFVDALGFQLLEDTPLGAEKRWVRVAPAGGKGAALLLARAATAEQRAQIGNQAGGRVFLFLETDDVARDHAALQVRGVRFLEPPRRESYGTVAVFEDLYGNRWDLIEPAGRLVE
jgi:catechol 2,3-dioxygenase-like lactoylglutathione lyase family enzyme